MKVSNSPMARALREKLRNQGIELTPNPVCSRCKQQVEAKSWDIHQRLCAQQPDPEKRSAGDS